VVGVTVKPISGLAITQNYMFGPEQSGNNDDFRHLSDTLVLYTATPKLSFAANYDYGRESFGESDVHWQGIAAYAKFQPYSNIYFSPRVELFDDADGFATGVVQKLKEVTGTLELRASDNLQWRLEYRRDWSNESPFVNDKGEAKNHQQSVGFGLLYSFARNIQ
jgi:hypothetical protein